MQDVLRYVYTREEEEAVTRAMEARFGKIARILRENAPADAAGIRVDLCVIPAGAQVTVVTRGMGAREMRLPVELRGQGLERAELAISLPGNWELRSREERWVWPLRWLRLLARLPAEEDSWLGWGHTVPGGEPFAENTGLCALLLLDADEGQDGPVQFYRLVPLYEEELRFKLEHGTQALLEHFAGGAPLVLDPARPSLFPVKRGDPEESHSPLSAQAEICLVTERVLDGAPVGYCYREAPCGDWDSGWRFTAGDESDEYMADPRHAVTVPLREAADCDRDILPILATPPPCAFARSRGGLERLKNIR